MKLTMKILLFLLILAAGPFVVSGQGERPVTVGIFTDCQYCDCNPGMNRFYRFSLAKIDRCADTFNTLPLDAVFHLGDMIDHGYRSYDSVMPRFARIEAPFYKVLGNHDFMVGRRYRDSVMHRAGIVDPWYRVDISDWSFLVLNGNDLSYTAPQTKQQRQERNGMVAGLFSALRFNGLPWNGGIGSVQMEWLEEQLKLAEQGSRKVVVACHFPLFSKGNHNLFNNEELFALISRYRCVKAWFSGHYHAGNYQEREGIHLLNFMGMVDTPHNAFSVVTLTGSAIKVKGYGREPDRSLELRK